MILPFYLDGALFSSVIGWYKMGSWNTEPPAFSKESFFWVMRYLHGLTLPVNNKLFYLSTPAVSIPSNLVCFGALFNQLLPISDSQSFTISSIISVYKTDLIFLSH